LKYLLPWVLLLATVSMGAADIDCPLGSVYYTISVPEGLEHFWCWMLRDCCVGFRQSGKRNNALNHLHQGFDMLPAYTTPETYLESYLPGDFSLGENQVTAMRIIGYEENLDLANAFASYTGFLASGKSMKRADGLWNYSGLSGRDLRSRGSIR